MKLFAPRYLEGLSTALYLVQGWAVVVAWHPLVSAVPERVALLLDDRRGALHRGRGVPSLAAAALSERHLARLRARPPRACTMSPCSTFSASERRSQRERRLGFSQIRAVLKCGHDHGSRRKHRDPHRTLPSEACSPSSPRGSAIVSRPAPRIREQHGHTLTWIRCEPPDAVLFAETTDEVVEAVKLCAEARMPVIPFGTGTSLEGHVNAPLRRGLARSLAHEPHPRRACRGPRLRGRAGRHPQGAQRAFARSRAVLPHRSRRRRKPWRHGGDARLGHQRRALRHHAR